jgi:hypothetical protein
MVAKVGFEVIWQASWPLLGDQAHKAGEIVTILPGDRLPASHPIVAMHGEYFAND